MDFAFDEDQELLRESTRGFLQHRDPIARVRTRLEAEEVVDRDVWRDGAELGWAALLVPPEHGGGSITGQPLVDLVVLAEEFGRALAPGPLLPTNVVADCIARFGTEGQRRDLLPGIAAGSTVATWCVSGDGTLHERAVDVRVSWDGDDVVCHGVAGYVEAATTADLFLVTARAAGDEGEGRLVHLVVPAHWPGCSVRRLAGLDLTRRFGEVRFEDVRLPADAVLGPGGSGGQVRERAAAVATVLQCAAAVGASEHLFATTVDYLRQRVQFGRPIASFQAIKHRLADLLVSVEAMRAAAHYAALAVADDMDDAAEAVATAGAYVKPTAAGLAGECLQLTGGIGFTWEHDLHLYLRRARVDEVCYGDATWHRERLCSLAAGEVG